MTIRKRKKGAVWAFRWWETQGDGQRVQREKIVGSLAEFPTLRAARRAIESERVAINARPGALPVGMTVQHLVTHYEAQELTGPGREQSEAEASEGGSKAHSTRLRYRCQIRKWILPRWGSVGLGDVHTVDVKHWLSQLPLARPTRSSIRNLLHVLFNHAVEYEWLASNPITLVRQSGKRTRIPVILDIGQMGALLSRLAPLERTLVLLAASTGLRISELLALKWKDVDLLGKELHVTRAIYRQVVGRCKTENSQKALPIDDCTLQDLLAWWQVTPFKAPDDWVFASARRAGRQPCWPDTLLQKRVRPAAHGAGITSTIGWHTFRRSFSSWLKSSGADMKVVQELMRHANLRTTMDLYTQAPMGAKREAQRKIAEQIALGRA
ncbi:MAG: site-specific integrase [Terriglobales bacterium]